MEENNSIEQTALIHNADKGNAGMSLEQLNEYLVKLSKGIKDDVREKRATCISYIITPICSIKSTLHSNITNVMACYHNTLIAAFHIESEYIKTFNNYTALVNVLNGEKDLIFDFLDENNLTEKFNEFVKRQKIKQLSSSRC
jgi:hypothetical protein